MLKLVSQFDPPQARPSQATPTCCCCCCCCLFSTIGGSIFAGRVLGERNVPAPVEALPGQTQTASCQAEDAPGQPEAVNPLGCFVPMLSLGLLLGLLFLFCLAGGKFYVPLLVFSCLLGIIPLCYYWAYKKSFVIVLGLGIATALCMAAEIVVTTLLLSFIAKLL